ncbi:hypothetical protein K9L97_03195 [Candidatus Woesearchaeota archaeon]|nr:hypothetical protein [Candidatus Woesearchaeota archaeon]
MNIDDIVKKMSKKKQLSLLDKIKDKELANEIANEIANEAKYQISDNEINLVVENTYINKDEFVKKYGLENNTRIKELNKDIYKSFLVEKTNIDEAIKFGKEYLIETDYIEITNKVLSEISTTHEIDANGALGWLVWPAKLSVKGERVLEISTKVLEDKELAKQYMNTILDKGFRFPENALKIFEKTELENMVLEKLSNGESPRSSKYLKDIIDIEKNKETLIDIVIKKIDNFQTYNTRYVGSNQGAWFKEEPVYNMTTNKGKTAELIFNLYKDLDLKKQTEFEEIMYKHIKKSLDKEGKLPQDGFKHNYGSPETEPKRLDARKIHELISEEHSSEILKQLYKSKLETDEETYEIREAISSDDAFKVLIEQLENPHIYKMDLLLREKHNLVHQQKKESSYIKEFDTKSKEISMNICENAIEKGRYDKVSKFIQNHYKDKKEYFDKKILVSKIQNSEYDLNDLKKAESIYEKNQIEDLTFKLFKKTAEKGVNAIRLDNLIEEYNIEGHEKEIGTILIENTQQKNFFENLTNLNREYRTGIKLLEKTGDINLIKKYIKTATTHDILQDESSKYLFEMAKKYEVKESISIMQEIGYPNT